MPRGIFGGEARSSRSNRSIAALRLRFAALRTGAPFKTFNCEGTAGNNFPALKVLRRFGAGLRRTCGKDEGSKLAIGRRVVAELTRK